MDALTLVLLALAGLGAGVLASLFGIGGGIVMVPVLHYGFAFTWAQATAVSLAAIALTAPLSVLAHARRGAVQWALAIPMAVGGLAGVAVGQWLQPRVEVPWLKLLFALLMGLAAWRLVQKPSAPRWHTKHPVYLLSLGAVAGLISKLLGIGGGLLTVPALALTGTAIHVAVGSSLVPVFTNAAVATAHHVADRIELLAALPLAAGAVLGIPVGARLAHALPDKGLRRVFAGGLIAAGILVAATSGAF